MPDPRATPHLLWTPAQRGVLIAFVLILASVLLILLARERQYVSNPPPIRGERYGELADRIDPNIATWQELAVLPQIGEKRAKEIVAYREGFVARRPNTVPFARPHDLMEVKGIGPAVVETLRPHLAFPTTQAAVARSSAESPNRPPPDP
jgi:competence protein ComEA